MSEAGADGCIFCKIVRGEIPSAKVYEDDDVLAFNDIQPVAPVHVLLIPKLHFATMYDCSMAHQQLLGKMMALAPEIARKCGANDGFRLIVNTGRVGRQEVYHLHLHIIGGPAPLPGMLTRG